MYYICGLVIDLTRAAQIAFLNDLRDEQIFNRKKMLLLVRNLKAKIAFLKLFKVQIEVGNYGSF